MMKVPATRIRMLNSVLFYTLAFNLIYFLHELGLVLAGAYWGNAPILYHNNMSYLNTTRPEQVLAFAFGPLVVLLVGLACWGALVLVRRTPAWLTLLLLWIGFHGCFIFLIQTPSIAFDAHPTDLAKAVLFYEPSRVFRIFMTVAGLTGLFVLNSVLVKLVLAHAPCNEPLDTSAQRRSFAFKSIAVTWFFGTLLILPFRVPPLAQAGLPLISGLFLLWSWLLAGNFKAPRKATEQVAQVNWGALAALLLVFAGFRFVLAGGVPIANFNMAAHEHVRVYRFEGGFWFSGEGFEPKTFYSVDGVLQSTCDEKVEKVIDLHGQFVMPPFADAHTHHFIDSSSVRGQIADYFQRGIFYAKNPNNIPQLTAQIRAQLNQPHSIDVAFANGGLTASGGHPVQIFDALAQQGNLAGLTQADMPNHAYFIIDNENDLETRWPLILAGEPNFIKVYLEYSEEYAGRKDDPKYFGRRGLNPKLLPQIVARAHAESLCVTAHVNTAADFHNAIAAGCDEIAHLPLARIEEKDVALAAQSGVIVVTTTISHRPTDHVADIDEVHRHNLRALHKVGVTLALGTDDNNRTVLDEVENLRRLQVFDDLTLLRLCVDNTPRTIFPERKIGALQEGYEASFLVLAGNPLEDFDNLRKIALRFKQGHLIELSQQFTQAATKPSIANEISHEVFWRSVEAGIAKYQQLKQERPHDFNFAESELNNLGYTLLHQNKKKEAIAIFKLNTEEYPGSANAFDSLAEAYLANGEVVQARACYEKVLELLPSSNYNAEFKSRLEKTAREKLLKIK